MIYAVSAQESTKQLDEPFGHIVSLKWIKRIEDECLIKDSCGIIVEKVDECWNY